MRAMESLLPTDIRSVTPPPVRIDAVGEQRATVGLLTGCVQRVFFGPVNAATARVLAAEGCAVVVPGGQGCCGALSMHAGREEEARSFARALIDAFDAEGERLDAVVVNAAGCGSTMKAYGHLLAADPRYADGAAAFASKVRDATELLAGLPPVAARHPVAVTAAYHDACHLAHAQGVRAEPRAVLRSVPGLEVREIAEGEICCGSAGVYNLLEPGPAAELGRRKAANVIATGAQVVVTGNPGCAMQIQASIRAARGDEGLPVVHPMEVLDASIRGVALIPSTQG